MFGEEFVESVDAEARQPPSVERPETSEFISTVMEARGNLSFKEIKSQLKTTIKDSIIGVFSISSTVGQDLVNVIPTKSF